jgi:hypothetical protein
MSLVPHNHHQGSGSNGAERKAEIVLGEERIAVRLDDQGFLTRVLRKVRLQYGTELYCASRNPSDSDKVQPYQPGYLKLIAAMGGQLQVPPTMRDPQTGEIRPNPVVEYLPGTGIIRRVTATAVCLARDFTTGEWHASIQTITVDAEHILRQALMKLTRDDEVRLMSDEEYEQERAELKHWIRIPLLPPFANIVCNMKASGVREAWKTYGEQAATIRQRACSKAERLAADHNPVTRMTWFYGQLRRPDEGAPYIEVPVVAWVQHQGRQEMDRMLQALATEGKYGTVSDVVVGDQVDTANDADPVDDEDNNDSDSMDSGAYQRRVITDTVSPASVPTPAPEPVRVETPVAAPAAPEPTRAELPKVEPAKPEPVKAPEPAKPKPESSKARERLINQCAAFEGEIGDAAVGPVRLKHKLPLDGDLPADLTTEALRAYRDELQHIAEERS